MTFLPSGLCFWHQSRVLSQMRTSPEPVLWGSWEEWAGREHDHETGLSPAWSLLAPWISSWPYLYISNSFPVALQVPGPLPLLCPLTLPSCTAFSLLSFFSSSYLAFSYSIILFPHALGFLVRPISSRQSWATHFGEHLLFQKEMTFLTAAQAFGLDLYAEFILGKYIQVLPSGSSPYMGELDKPQKVSIVS